MTYFKTRVFFVRVEDMAGPGPRRRKHSPLACEVIRILAADGVPRTKVEVEREIVKIHGDTPQSRAYLCPQYPEMPIDVAVRNALLSFVRSRRLKRVDDYNNAPYALADDFSATEFLKSQGVAPGNELPTYEETYLQLSSSAAAAAAAAAAPADEPLPSGAASASSDSGAVGPDKSKKRSRDHPSTGAATSEDSGDSSSDTSSGDESDDDGSARASKRLREEKDAFAYLREASERLREVHESLLAKKIRCAKELKEATAAHEAFLRQYSSAVKLSVATKPTT